MRDYEYEGSTPGVSAPKLSAEPLGTAGELSPGPDDLDPERPRDRRELERQGYLPRRRDGQSDSSEENRDGGGGGGGVVLASFGPPRREGDGGGSGVVDEGGEWSDEFVPPIFREF